MTRSLWFASIALVVLSVPVSAAGISGQYIEARTCDVWVAACFANAEVNLTGKNAVMAWKVDKGSFQDVNLDGLGVVAVVAASDTLGVKQTGSSKAMLIVDSKASAAQREALVGLARQQGGDLIRNVINVQTADIDLTVSQCKDGGCACLQAGKVARIETRCIDGNHDKVCGNESAFYPPLAKSVKAKVAVAVEHSFSGAGLNATWKDAERRGAYVGSFEIQ